jgi:hypothetical protein
MTARKKQHVSFYSTHPADNEISPRAHLVGRFASGAPVSEQLPIRSFRMDFGRAATFILAVVPFEQIAIYIGCGAEAGQLTGPSCALQGTGKNLGEIQPL